MHRFEGLSGKIGDLINKLKPEGEKRFSPEKLIKTLETELNNSFELASSLPGELKETRVGHINTSWASLRHNPLGHLAEMGGRGADRKINPEMHLVEALEKIYISITKLAAADEKLFLIFSPLQKENSKMFPLTVYLEELRQAIAKSKLHLETKTGTEKI